MQQKCLWQRCLQLNTAHNWEHPSSTSLHHSLIIQVSEQTSCPQRSLPWKTDPLVLSSVQPITLALPIRLHVAYHFVVIFLSSPKDMPIDFQREGKGGRGEKHCYEKETLIGLPSIHTPTRDWTCNLGLCPTGNGTHDLLVYRNQTLQPTPSNGATPTRACLPLWNHLLYVFIHQSSLPRQTVSPRWAGTGFFHCWILASSITGNLVRGQPTLAATFIFPCSGLGKQWQLPCSQAGKVTLEQEFFFFF